MLDLKFIVENAEAVKEALSYRSGTYDVQRVVDLDARRKALIGDCLLYTSPSPRD